MAVTVVSITLTGQREHGDGFSQAYRCPAPRSTDNRMTERLTYMLVGLAEPIRYHKVRRINCPVIIASKKTRITLIRIVKKKAAINTAPKSFIADIVTIGHLTIRTIQTVKEK